MRILVVEDDPILADALAHSLRDFGYAVDTLASGADADHALAAEDFDLVILDLELPALHGFDVLQRLRERRKTVPVLILTALVSVHDRIHGLDIGADDYLAKPFAMGELRARIRALIRRAKGRAENVIECGPLSVDVKARRAAVNSVPLECTARELAVLEVLAARAGRVVSKDALLSSVYAWDDNVGPNAIEIIVHRLRKKLIDSGIRIRTARGLGYLLEVAAGADKQASDED